MMKRVKVFIDTNIPIYASGREHPNKKPSLKLLESILNGSISGVTSTEVLQEILYRYKAIGLLGRGLEVFDYFSQIVDEVLPINFQIMMEARNILEKEKHQNIFPRDAIHVAVMNYYGIGCIATYDKHFSAFKHIKCISL